jgi:hypothetical protein
VLLLVVVVLLLKIVLVAHLLFRRILCAGELLVVLDAVHALLPIAGAWLALDDRRTQQHICQEHRSKVHSGVRKSTVV